MVSCSGIRSLSNKFIPDLANLNCYFFSFLGIYIPGLIYINSIGSSQKFLPSAFTLFGKRKCKRVKSSGSFRDLLILFSTMKFEFKICIFIIVLYRKWKDNLRIVKLKTNI